MRSRLVLRGMGSVALVGLTVVGLMLPAACGDDVKAEDIQGLLQAISGKEAVVTLSDGSTVTIMLKDDKAVAETQKLVGQEVTAKVRSDDKRLIEVKDAGEDANLTGAIESIGANTWTIGGKTFNVDAKTMLDGGLVVGAQARVEFVTMPDGSLLATEIETDADDDKFVGVVEKAGPDQFVIGGRTFKVTAGTQVDDGLVAGVRAKVEFTTLPDGTMVATEIETEQDDHKSAGTIESMNQDVVRIGGREFKVNEATKLDDNLAVGVKVRVEFVKLADGIMIATEIESDEQEKRLSGVVESISATTLVVNGRTFKVTESTRIKDEAEKGDAVRVKFMTMPDGTMLVTRIDEDKSGQGGGKGEGEGRPSQKPEQEKPKAEQEKPEQQKPEDAKVTGMIDSISANAVVIGGKTFKVDASTMLDQGLAAGVTATVEFITQADGTMVAKQVETGAKGEPEPGDDKGGKIKPGDDKGAGVEPGDDKGGAGKSGSELGEDMKVSGAIEAISADTVVIGGKTFKIDASTIRDTGLAVGVMATVEFIKQADGTMVAKQVETGVSGKAEPGDDKGAGVEPGDDKGGAGASGSTSSTSPDEDMKVSGAIESISADKVVIGGKTFKVDASTMLDQGLAVGVTATVEFITQADGTMVAKQIETGVSGEAEPGEDMKVTGTIESITASSVVIGGKTFKIDAITLLDQGLVAGVTATIEFVTMPDGSLLARHIETGASGEAEPGDDKGGGIELGDDRGGGSGSGSSGSGGSGPG